MIDRKDITEIIKKNFLGCCKMLTKDGFRDEDYKLCETIILSSLEYYKEKRSEEFKNKEKQ